MNVSLTLSSYLVGTGSSVWGITNITGLDDVVVKAADTDLHFANGVVASRDYLAAHPIIADLITQGTTQAEAEAAAHALRTAWLPTVTDSTLTAVFAGTSHSITGRSRGVVFDRKQAVAGIIRAQATFLNTY